jgi:hypothetical protein
MPGATGRVSHTRNGVIGVYGPVDGGGPVPLYVYVVDTGVNVGVGWFCAVIVSTPVDGSGLAAVYVTRTEPPLSEPKRFGALVIFSLANIEKLLTPVAVPPPALELDKDRRRNAPGTGFGERELSTAMTVNITCCPAVSEPVVAIGTLLI